MEFNEPHLLILLPFISIFLLLLLLKKRKRTKLDFASFLAKLTIISFLLIVSAEPTKTAINNGTLEQNNHTNILYIEISGHEEKPEKLISTVIRNFASTKIIARIYDKLYLLNRDSYKQTIIERTKVLKSQSTKERNSIETLTTSFKFLEQDIAELKQKHIKLQLLGLYNLKKSQKNWLAEKNISWDFYPFNQVKTFSSNFIKDIVILPQNPSTNQIINVSIHFSKEVNAKDYKNLTIKLDGVEQKSATIEKKLKNISLILPGYKSSGIHKLDIKFSNENFTEYFLIKPNPNIFIFGGASELETQSDTFLLKLCDNINVIATITENLPKNLWDFDAGCIRVLNYIELNSSDRQRLENWVSSGGGLLMTYGQDIELSNNQLQQYKSFIPLEPILLRESEDPDVDNVEKLDKDEEFARITLLLMIDNSGSMAQSIGGTSRFEYVQAAAKRAIKNLDEQDYIGIYTFAKDAVAKITPTAAKNKEQLLSEIDKINPPGGGTNFQAACEKAIEVLGSDKSAVKHLLILSDGEATINEYYNLNKARKLFEENNINCSVIGFGEYNPEKLLQLKTAGGAKYFMDPGEKDMQGFYKHKLADFILHDVKIAREKLKQKIEEKTEIKPNDKKDHDFEKAKKQSILTGNINLSWSYNPFADFDLTPAKILSFVESSKYPSTFTIMNAQYKNEFFPFMVGKNFGKGRIIGICADMNAEFIPSWFKWAETPKLFMEIVNYLKSTYYKGIEIFPPKISFEIDQDSHEIVKFISELNKQSTDVNSQNLHAHFLWNDNSSSGKEIIQKLTDQSLTLKQLRSKCENIWGIEFRFSKTEQPFEIVKIPKYLKINGKENSKPEKLMNFEVNSSKENWNNKLEFMYEPEIVVSKSINYSLFSALLALSLIVFLLEIFFKR